MSSEALIYFALAVINTVCAMVNYNAGRMGLMCACIAAAGLTTGATVAALILQGG